LGRIIFLKCHGRIEQNGSHGSTLRVSAPAQTEVQPEEDYSFSLIPGEASADFDFMDQLMFHLKLGERVVVYDVTLRTS
jgi:hypothetical protein